MAQLAQVWVGVVEGFQELSHGHGLFALHAKGFATHVFAQGSEEHQIVSKQVILQFDNGPLSTLRVWVAIIAAFSAQQKLAILHELHLMWVSCA